MPERTSEGLDVDPSEASWELTLYLEGEAPVRTGDTSISSPALTHPGLRFTRFFSTSGLQAGPVLYVPPTLAHQIL